MAINSTNINIGKIYSYFICSQSIDQNIFPEVLRSAQCYIALYPAPGESLGFCCSNDMPIFFSTSTNDAFNVQRGQHSPRRTLPKMANCLVVHTMIHQIEKVLTTRNLESHWVELKKGSPVLSTQITFILF
jgi:hypothetical protein